MHGAQGELDVLNTNEVRQTVQKRDSVGYSVGCSDGGGDGGDGLGLNVYCSDAGYIELNSAG